MNIAIQFNGKTRGVMSISSELNKDEILNKIKKDQKFSKYFEGSDIKKEIMFGRADVRQSSRLKKKAKHQAKTVQKVTPSIRKRSSKWKRQYFRLPDN